MVDPLHPNSRRCEQEIISKDLLGQALGITCPCITAEGE